MKCPKCGAEGFISKNAVEYHIATTECGSREQPREKPKPVDEPVQEEHKRLDLEKFEIESKLRKFTQLTPEQIRWLAERIWESRLKEAYDDESGLSP